MSEQFDAFINALPQEQQDKLRTSIMEMNEVSIAIAKTSKERDFSLAVESDGKVYLNVSAIENLLLKMTPLFAFGVATPEDFRKTLICLGDLVGGAKEFVKAEA